MRLRYTFRAVCLLALLIVLCRADMRAQAAAPATTSPDPVMGKVTTLTATQLSVQKTGDASPQTFVIKPPLQLCGVKLGDIAVVVFKWDGEARVVVSAQVPGAKPCADNSRKQAQPQEYGKTAHNEPAVAPAFRAPMRIEKQANAGQHPDSPTETKPDGSTPVFEIPKGSYTAPETVALTDSNPGSTIHYTIDGDNSANAQSRPSSTVASTGSRALRVAVLDFDDAPVKTEAAALLGTDAHVGNAFSRLLVNQLTKSNDYKVIESSELDRMMKEQNFSNSNRVDSISLVKLGRMLDADAIIVGKVNTFGPSSSTDMSHGFAKGLYGVPRKNLSGQIVDLSARVIDTHTGETLAVLDGRGRSASSGLSSSGSASEKTELDSPDFQKTPIGEASTSAVLHLVMELLVQSRDIKAAATSSRAPDVMGLVADVSSGNVTVTLSGPSGLAVGDKVPVLRTSRHILDPVTRKTIRTIEDTVGELTITSVDSLSATGTFSGPGSPKVGDTVKVAARPLP